jgi:AcrR family transcriptional regulator
MDGRSLRWEAHNAAQRDRIVDAGIALIEETGDLPTLLEVGQRAGVSRSVLYRQFADRSDLEKAVRARGLTMFWTVFQPALEMRGTVRESLRTAAAAYVHWAASNRYLHQRADQSPDDNADLQRSVDLIAEQIAALAVTAFRAAGANVTEADVEATDPLAHGLVNGVYAVVRRWLARGGKVPSEERLVDLLVEFGEGIITSRALSFGLEVDFDLPMSALISPSAP